MEKKSKTTQEILDFWTLCEIVDFERLNLHKDNIGAFYEENPNEANKSLVSELKCGIDYKKTTVYKVYIGLVRSDETIKFIYKKLEERDLLPKGIKAGNDSDMDIENIPVSNDFTYMAYMYVDREYRLISVDGVAIKINPLFYILKSLLEKSIVNTEAYKKYIEKINLRFCEDYSISKDRDKKLIFIPDIEWFTYEGGDLSFLTKIQDCDIYIMDDLINDLTHLSNSDDKVKKQLKILENEREKDESIFIFQKQNFNFETPNHYLEIAKKLAKKFYYKNIYLITSKKKKYDDIQIPSNLYITWFISKKHILNSSIVYSKSENNKLTLDIQKEIFEKFCKELYLTDKDENIANIFYMDNRQTLSIFEQRFFEKTFQYINDLEDMEFLSFYINALDEEASPLTRKYIFGTNNRTDINKDSKIRKEHNKLELFKNIFAKWASPYPLYYAQQMAVNNFIKNLGLSKNIFSVNGPPGTGKTTLLKDIIADTVTKRVEHCIRLDGELFESGVLKDELCGKYEIVVSSNNNAAVENITRELPRVEEFDFEYVGFKKEDFLLGKFSDDFYGFDAWSIISINLGNSKNIDSFVDKFDTLCKAVSDANLINQDMLLNRKKELIEKFKKNSSLIDLYNRDFETLNQEDRVNELYKVQQEEFDNIEKDRIILEESIAKLRQDIKEAQSELKKDTISKDRSEQIISLKEDELSSFGFFKSLFKRGEFNELKKHIVEQKSILSDSLISLQHSENSYHELSKKYKNELQNLKNFDSKSKEIKDKIEELKKAKNHIKDLKESYKQCNINSDLFYSKAEKDIQQSSIYNDEEYLKSKSKQFALSMQLSEVYFLLNLENYSKCIRDFTKNCKSDLDEKSKMKLKKDFSALCMFLPVISTSLASSYLMFKNIDNFSIFICDESGQATPQSLVGLLNRATNAMIVGDPLQVKPVFTAPSILVKLIQNMYDIEDIHSPICSSAQSLADNSNSVGSYYKIDDQELWVGMPLVVHRRCVEPMFGISNRVSYNEKMVLNTPAIKQDDPINKLPPSGWIDVISQESDFDRNISLKEIKSLKEFINSKKEILIENYFVISPFRGIDAKKYGLRSDNEKKDKTVGTVHTFQGKEADVVFFILGGNVSREGAKGWVSSEANILNVATTRARKRIYFVGDKSLWSRHRYFKDAIELIKDN